MRSGGRLAFSDGAAAAAFFSDHVLWTNLEEVEGAALWLFATLAVLLPGWRNWQTRRP